MVNPSTLGVSKLGNRRSNKFTVFPIVKCSVVDVITLTLFVINYLLNEQCRNVHSLNGQMSCLLFKYSLTSSCFFTDPRQCFDLLLNSVANTDSEMFFLSILQHLLTIREDVTVR